MFNQIRTGTLVIVLDTAADNVYRITITCRGNTVVKYQQKKKTHNEETSIIRLVLLLLNDGI